ncbi:GNAT family N-acetyltransferase [Candidatus Puniceispirillum marinum]|uniref:Acetyltransferase n=1 Tax=Puniceispirillum marinum (strain IMCC1322) TaxID=488538 RepID=D5BRP4_PUNMI|nr:GNAT family N-acetyltransferase [Candidatus Puniceispirillum marinum]ADE38941.1 Acetyltransferase [Candidatus Puniceispirillum marinum IMCC1322]
MNVRPVTQADRNAWEHLYRGYADYYKVETNDAKLDTLFTWLCDVDHVCEGLVADKSGQLIGLAHFRAMPSPLRAANVGFLDDLFVDPAQRGSGAAKTLIHAIDAIAGQRGWDVVRWITRDDNYRARALYDKLSTRSNWLVYEMTAETTGR